MENTALPTMYELCLLHARADRAMRAVVSRQLEVQKITMMEWLALGVVVTGPKNGVSMTNIAKVLDVTMPQVTALISNLISTKLIRQKVLASDRRGRQVMATLKGKRTIDKLELTIAKAMKSWSSHIEKRQLINYIKTVSELAKVNN